MALPAAILPIRCGNSPPCLVGPVNHCPHKAIVSLCPDRPKTTGHLLPGARWATSGHGIMACASVRGLTPEPGHTGFGNGVSHLTLRRAVITQERASKWPLTQIRQALQASSSV